MRGDNFIERSTEKKQVKILTCENNTMLIIIILECVAYPCYVDVQILTSKSVK